MAVQPILLYPHPILKRVSHQIERFDDEILRLADDLVDTMRAAPGSVGVAAPQIGVLLRMCVVDVSENRYGRENNHGLLVMANPVIVHREGSGVLREGCMSVPDYTGDVERSTRVVVTFQDPEGGRHQVDASGFEAVAIQHEMDHLDGLLFLDRIASLKTGLFRRKTYR